MVVMPTSLIPNWLDEAAHFTPQLKVVALYGATRKKHFDNLADYDLILTTYALLPKDVERLAACETLAVDPRIKVTAFEKTLGTSYTAKTLEFIRARNPHVHFIWIMGADNLAGFHRWQRWQKIASTFPVAVIDRPGSTLAYLSSKMARTFDYARIDEEDAGVLWQKRAPAWTFIHGPRSTLSSSAIRAAAHKP